MRRLLFALPVLALGLSSGVWAQTSGEIDGTVRDAQGLVLPGVTVTLSGEAVLGSQATVSLADGTYRFRALRPGSYNLNYELSGFQTLNREGIVVSGARTITVNVTLDVATVAETITVTGESPVVDVKNTALSNEFGVEELQDVPSATDVWAVLSQTPGVRMMGYDVGGSHKSQQVGYESFGIRNQNRVLSDGVDSTEGTGGTGFYYDYYSVEEFTTAAAGADVEMTSPGSLVMMTLKSGGNELSGLYHADYEGESFVSDNLDDELRGRGYTGNPNLLFYELHADLGGPIIGDKAWFYGFFNKFRIDKAISGVDPAVATDIGNFYGYGGKLTLQVTPKDQFIGYSQWGLKQKPNRGLSAAVPPESILAQDSWSWVHKAEWQRVWNERTFTNIQFKHFGFGWPMVPNTDPAVSPPRYDRATSLYSGAGWNGQGGPPFTFDRWKPQATATANYYVPAAKGSHDFKFGFDWQIDSSQYGSNSNSGAIQYWDNSSLGRPLNADEIRLFNVKAEGANQADNRDTHTAFFVQDTWSPNDRLTLNLGLRFHRQVASYEEATLEPFLSDFFPTGTIEGQTLVSWNNVAPRLGLTYDVAGTGKTVLKAHYGRYYANIADQLSAANPGAYAYVHHKFLDQNANGLYDGSSELGALVTTRGTVGTNLANARGTPVNPDLSPEYVDEISASVEHELMPDTSLRFSYVRKSLRNDFELSWNQAQVIPLLERGLPFEIPCNTATVTCPGDFNGTTLNLLRVPEDAANQVSTLIDTYPGGYGSSDYDTFQVAFQRRFSADFFVQTSFDYQWRDEIRRATGISVSPLNADPLSVNFWQNHNYQNVDTRQPSKNWNFRLLGRYVLPAEVAVSANLRVQSGWPWAPVHSLSIPGSGTQSFFLEDIDNNYSESVTLVDIRLEKGFVFGDRYKVTGLFDVYNLMNSNAETNFFLTTGRTYRNIIAALDPRAMKIGVRFQF
jgi:hypothetical protein